PVRLADALAPGSPLRGSLWRRAACAGRRVSPGYRLAVADRSLRDRVLEGLRSHRDGSTTRAKPDRAAAAVLFDRRSRAATRDLRRRAAAPARGLRRAGVERGRARAGSRKGAEGVGTLQLYRN